MRNNIVKDKSYEFSIKVLKMYKSMSSSDRIIFDQLRKSATSIGANIEEANGAPSKKDFTNKIFIAYKEARESNYWIRILMESGFLNNIKANELLENLEHILRLLGKILKTSRRKFNN